MLVDNNTAGLSVIILLMFIIFMKFVEFKKVDPRCEHNNYSFDRYLKYESEVVLSF